MRVLIDTDPYLALDEGKTWPARGIWPCKWIFYKEAGKRQACIKKT